MANSQDARVKLTNTQLNKLTSTAKNRAVVVLRVDKKTLKMKNCHRNYF